MQLFHILHCVVFNNPSNQHWNCFVYYKYMNHNKKTAPRYDYVYQVTNYYINGK